MRQHAVGVRVLHNNDLVHCGKANLSGKKRAPDLDKRGKVFNGRRVLVEKLAEHLVL